MKRILAFLLIGITGFGFGQNSAGLVFEKTFGGSDHDTGCGLIQTADGDFVLVGRSKSVEIIDEINNPGATDAWIIKLDENAEMIWEKSIGGSGSEFGDQIIETDDFGYLFQGMTWTNDGTMPDNHGGIDGYLVKMDVDGEILWQRCYGGTSTDQFRNISPTNDGNFIAVGIVCSNDGDLTGITGAPINGDCDAWVMKLDPLGNIIWQKSLGGSLGEDGYNIIQTIDGGYLFTGSTKSNDGDVSFNNGSDDVWIVKLDEFGNIIWEKTFGGSANDVGSTSIQNTFGDFVVVATTYSNDGDISMNNGVQDAWLICINSDGDLLWERTYGGSFGDAFASIISSGDQGYLLSGNTYSNDGDVSGNNGTSDAWIVEIDALGNILNQLCVGGSEADNVGGIGSLIQTEDDQFAILGSSKSDDGGVSFNQGGYDYWFFKLNNHNIRGRVYNDLSEDCIQNTNEIGIYHQGVPLIIDPGNILVTSTLNGIWSIDSLPIGTYTVTIDTTTSWRTTCPPMQTFTVTDPNGFTQGPDFGMVNTNPCTDPDVSIFAPSLRRCFSDRIVYVSACNQVTATDPLDSSYVDVELDPLLTVDAASLPYTELGDNIFRFETGDIYPGQCVNFTLSTSVSCDAINGQTLCVEATLYPAEDCIFDSIPSDPITNDGIGGTLDGLPSPCTIPWDTSSLSVKGYCDNDTVYFIITNAGLDMQCYSPLWLTVDGVVTDTDSLQLQSLESVIYSYPGTGQTFILNVSQHPLHPGNSAPNAHVELCGDSTNWSSGIVNQFPHDDADPDVDIYCGEVTAPYDPNDKTGYPLGQTEDYYIQPNQQLQYVIRFQNVGTDTAFTVVVRDTLDIDLNIFTVTPGVSSYPYTFKMYGPRVLEWTFEGIQLPDSTTNAEGSNGFLTFHVDQVPDLEPGTVINNDADIYFDFELPITTNTTVHTIFEGFVDVFDPTVSIENYIEGEKIDIYPNPTTNLINVQSETGLNNRFKIYDQQGREVMNGQLNGKNTEISLGKLSRGTYTIHIDGNYQPAVIIKQ